MKELGGAGNYLAMVAAFGAFTLLLGMAILQDEVERMMEQRSHRCRWWEAPQAGKLRRGMMDRLMAWIRREGKPEGRRRIDPEQPWGTWAAGWTGPAWPGKRER